MTNYKFYGVDVVGLAKKYGTPLYVMSEDYIEERCNEINRDLLTPYPNSKAVFASKAFQCLEMCRVVTKYGLGMDVVSGGEIFTALKAGVKAEDIMFHGNNKSRDELVYAVKEKIGRIIVDNLNEIDMLIDITDELNINADILFRITPGVDSYTHEFISTGHADSKFGVPIDRNARNGYFKKVLDAKNITIKGFHFHIGSQLHDNESHLKALSVSLDLIRDIKKDFNFDIEDLNIGGGFGIKYAGDEDRKPLKYFMEPVMKEVDKYCNENGLKQPRIIIEPGRWIAGEAGITLYEAGAIKKNEAGSTYVLVDGGMTDNIRTALYDAKYDAIVASNPDGALAEEVTIAGKCCESGDIVVKNVKLPKVETGDIIAVFATGAYNYTMSSNYNRLPRPAVVMIKDGIDRLIVHRETYEDMIAREI